MKKTNLMLGAALTIMLAACAATEPVTTETVDAETKGAQTSVTASGLNVVTHSGDFAEIQQFTTPGGVSVWLVTEPSIPILSVNMAWEGGEVADPDNMVGLANAVVYHMNEGAGDLDSLAFQTRMEELNMSFGCSTGNDWTSCSTSMLTDNAGEAMDLVASALSEPRFDEGPFERYMREQEVSLKTRETSPRYLAWRATSQALYKDHPYARETTAETLAAITPELAKAHKAKLMVKDRLLVTAVGAVTPEELAPMLDKAVAGLAETSEMGDTPVIALPDVGVAPLMVDLPQPQSLVQFTGPGVTRDDPDFFPAYVLNYTFGGGGFESRLMKTLRVEKGLTYGVYSGVRSNEHYPNWGGSGQTKNESAGEFVDGIKAEMQKLADTGVSAEELSDAKAYLMGSYPLGFDSNAKIAGNMMSVRQDELGVDYFDKRNAMVEAVTLEDVNRVAKEFLAPERYTFTLVGEPEGLK